MRISKMQQEVYLWHKTQTLGKPRETAKNDDFDPYIEIHDFDENLMENFLKIRRRCKTEKRDFDWCDGKEAKQVRKEEQIQHKEVKKG